jgi:hypothetical protein
MGDYENVLKPFQEHVEAEIGYEWKQKASTERRALGVMLSCLTMVSVFFTLAGPLGVVPGTSHRRPIIIGLVMLAAASLLAVLAIIPTNYPSIDVNDIEGLAKLALQREVDALDIRTELFYANVAALRSYQRANAAKVFVFFLATTLLIVGALILIWVLLYTAVI